MIRSTPELASFERRYARERGRDATYAGALEVFTALWVEAAALNPDFRADWREDIEPDLAIARALNELPPDA
ncbi:MAG: hypothetical protein Q8N53_08040 [Longimicrobiales bacterium]|nr:hypothetical protein [Longimicrobiales bacterium]